MSYSAGRLSQKIIRKPRWRRCAGLPTSRTSWDKIEVDIPGREMLGDLLLLEHKPAEALAEYRVALKLSPNRLNGLLSAGNAAEQAGLSDQARAFYRAAVLQTNSGGNSAARSWRMRCKWQVRQWRRSEAADC